MILYYSFIVGFFITLVLIPPLMTAAPRLGLVDPPGERKLHTAPVPRCGGIAIVVGALVPVLMWQPLDRDQLAYLAGALVIVAGGVWDDRQPLRAREKFLIQAIGAATALAGGIAFTHLPLFGPLPAWIALPFSLIYLVGVTNAVNLADGLDGLAGGLVLLTLAGLTAVAFLSGALPTLALAVPTAGAILGFLRYNTHPATVFMGDAGSQFLGFTVGVLTLRLVDGDSAGISPGLLLLFVGLPLIDTASVVVQRLRQGRSPFSPDRNHLHHQLLAFGFGHRQAVFIIYGVQAALVFSAVLLRQSGSELIIAVFCVVYAALIGIVLWARASGRRYYTAPPSGASVERRNQWLRRRTWLPGLAIGTVAAGAAAFLVVGSFIPAQLTRDVAVMALSVVGFALATHVFVKSRSRAVLRLAIYLAVLLIAFMVAGEMAILPPVRWTVMIYLGALIVALAIGIRVTRREMFRITPQDLLILFAAIAVPNLSGEMLGEFHIREVVVISLVLFYVTEFILARDQRRGMVVAAAALVSLTVIGVRGLIA